MTAPEIRHRFNTDDATNRTLSPRKSNFTMNQRKPSQTASEESVRSKVRYFKKSNK